MKGSRSPLAWAAGLRRLPEPLAGAEIEALMKEEGILQTLREKALI